MPTHENVRHEVWLGQLASRNVMDKIHVRNLQVTVNAGVDAWGRQKKQPALVSVTLYLANSFDSAAETDALDSSTVHYGILSKDIQACIAEQTDWLPTKKLAQAIQACVAKTTHGTSYTGLEVDIMYPKGSLLGDAAGLTVAFSWADGIKMASVCYLRNLRIPCLIGVNANERTAKQLVVVNLWIDNDSILNNRVDDHPKLEALVVDAVSHSSFETLESLTSMVVRELRDKFFTADEGGSYIRLRVEKPLAVPFADAPAVEILRPVKA